MNTQELTQIIVDALDDVKAKDIKIFNTDHLTDQFERVVIATGSSGTQTRAMAYSAAAAVKHAGGTVIGLSLVRAIADTLHGDCGAENVPGGIAFWFDIPDAPPQTE